MNHSPRNLFAELGYTPEQVDYKIQKALSQLFFSDHNDQCILFHVDANSAYIWTPDTEDIRSEGMSYGMVICAYLKRQDLFDKLWNFSKVYMQHASGPRKGFFAWNVKKTSAGFVMNDPNSAPDGEEYYAYALLLAEALWGNEKTNYGAEARYILTRMLHVEEDAENPHKEIRNFFHSQSHQIVFAPVGPEADYTDPSYHLPAFYKIFANAMPDEKMRWSQIIQASQEFLQKAFHEKTGLVTEYADFDGTPRKTSFNEFSHLYSADSWRMGLNLGMEYQWNGSSWTQELCERMLDFFQSFPAPYPAKYTKDGKPLEGSYYQSAGLASCNAVAALASRDPKHLSFVQDLWDLSIPDGKYRYYHGLLYLMALLHCSGQFSHPSRL